MDDCVILEGLADEHGRITVVDESLAGRGIVFLVAAPDREAAERARETMLTVVAGGARDAQADQSDHPAFGIWADRAGFDDPVAAARRLRDAAAGLDA